MLPFLSIAHRVARNLNMPVTGEYVERQIAQFINHVYRDIWDREYWPQTLTNETSVTLPEDQNYLVLSKEIQSIVRARREDGGIIDILAKPEFTSYYGANLESTDLRAIAPGGESGLRTQLSSNQTINVVSSSASDTTSTAVQVLLRGKDANGEVLTESVTVNGTTNAASTTTWSEIQSIGKNKNSVGYISIKNAAASATLATIGSLEGAPRYAKYIANITASADVTFYIVGKLRFQPLVNNADYPFTDLDLVLECGATELGFRENRDLQLAAIWWQKWKEAHDELLRREISTDGAIELMVPSKRG